MKLRIFTTLMAAVACLWVAQDARAGAIRYTGKQIGKGTVAVVQTTSDAAQAAGGSVASTGKATGGVLKAGAVAVGNGAKAAPDVVAHGASTIAKGLAKALW